MEKTEDAEVFGESVWVYCKSHLRPHDTGWCTVPASDKIALEAKTYADAVEECNERGFELYKG
ncbi:MAG: hypothetical protein ACKO0Z_07105 [Betaproteobacteria bacterium]